MDLPKEISLALQQGDDEIVFELTRQAIQQNISAKEILDHGLQPGTGSFRGPFGYFFPGEFIRKGIHLLGGAVADVEDFFHIDDTLADTKQILGSEIDTRNCFN